jgi:hypothetical protein
MYKCSLYCLLFNFDIYFIEPESISVSSEPARGQVRSTFMRKAKRKALRMSIFIVATFIICWFPYYVIYTRNAFGQSGETYDPTLITVLTTIGQSKTVLNPIIYGAFHLCKVHKPRLVGKAAFSKPSNNHDNAYIFLLVRTTDVKCIKIRPHQIRVDISKW